MAQVCFIAGIVLSFVFFKQAEAFASASYGADADGSGVLYGLAIGIKALL